ncbi:transcription termination factor MTERF6, chloroplastic/mitochondrial-like [Actinidia eriantha]|uniref:transcription termination factor MTERF6, chloroplastic/mitochondrial-like n=1 Tax=Actinidia eriantha TaxID=165200 RepID=UPI00258B12CD|nr:transcription termination factor MTERF6, chloroplastic/mitochondrial-like [Actinidia eriantha]
MLCNRVQLVCLTNAKAGLDLPKRTLFRSQITVFAKSLLSKRRTAEEQSFTVSYLISSCGLSPEAALCVSQKVNFPSADRPDSILTLLRSYGFTDTHISKIAKTRPNLLLSDPINTLLPKLEFFHSLGIPPADLAKTLSSNPALLGSSLKNQLIPVYNYLKHVILLDDKQVIKILKTTSWIFGINLEKKIVPKIAALIELGVPAANLSLLVTLHPYVLLQSRNKFDRTVKEVLEMGVNPCKSTFICILQMMIRMSKSSWENKMEVYRKCGWSDVDFHLAFKKQPLCVGISEKKIMSVMDFLVNEIGWEPTAVARVPSVLLYSLKKRTIPRCSVIKILILEGLVETNMCVSTVLTMSNKDFLDKYVTKYEENVPQLLNVFNGKVGLAELGYKFEETCVV